LRSLVHPDWVSKPTQELAELFVDRGLVTDEQKTELEKWVARELESHGGDSQAALAATMDGRSLEAIRGVGGENGSLEARLSLPQPEPDGHVMLEKLSPSDSESRERYTLTHLHAKGGMGRVWLALDTALGRQIALKELRPDQSDNSIVWSRFLYEAKITAQLEHPGIVPVYEVGEGKAPYYTMRFVRGRTLSEATRAFHKKRASGEADPLGLVELLNAFVGVCHTVAYAHSRGVIHRDLKGQNVVLGDFGEVMVLDWGLAKRMAPDQEEGSPPPETAGTWPELNQPTDPTRVRPSNQDEEHTLPEADDGSPGLASRLSSVPGTNGDEHHQTNASSNSGRRPSRESGAGPDGTMQGQLLGTPAYMAPEQAQGRHDLVDQRTDVYGLGAILYEILTGRPPFIAPKTVEIIRKVCNEPVPPPRQIVPAVSPGLEAVCLKALRKAKDDRYASASLLAQDVRRWLADEPVRAYDEPWVSRAVRWARRHKALVSTAAGLFVTATIALAVSTVLVASERNEAEAQGQQARQAVNLLTQVRDIGFEDQLDPKQEEFLKHALAYYEQFTGRAARDPAVRLEHGLAYQQMGDIQRKLGKPAKSEQAYRKAMDILEPMATAAQAGPEPKRALAQTRTLLGNLLVRLGREKNQIEAVYHQAIETQQTLASAPAATTEDRLRLGQTLKSQADLLRFNGEFNQAKTVYDKALAILEPARAADVKNHEIRNELALAIDARGLVYRELGQIKPAEQDFRRAQQLLNVLVAEFPTVSRFRESLAKAFNDLGVLKQDTGDLAAAETNLRRELPLVERLAQDFPGRPEHARQRARTLYNLGSVLLAQVRLADAEPILRRAVEVNGAIATKQPDDLQIRFDLAKCHHNLGEFLLEKGAAKHAITSFLRASEINEGLVKASPDFPRYRSLQATTLTSLGFARQQAKQPKVEETYRAALAIHQKLVTDYPDNVEYRIGQARCARNLGPILAEAGQAGQAEILYRRALTLLDARDEDQDARRQMQERVRTQVALLNNLGDLRRPGAEDAFRRSIAAAERLVTQKPTANNDYHILAIAQFNLGEFLGDLKRLPEAEPLLAQSVANFETLVCAVPMSVEFQREFGQVLEKQATFLARSDKPAEAKTALVRAVAHQRQAVRLSKNRDNERRMLGGHLLELAKINLELGAYQEAAGDALELPNTIPASDRGQACLDAARILARLVTKAGRDGKLAQLERDQLAKNYFGRTIVLLREAIDTNPKLSEQTKADSDIKALESRPEFQTIMNTLVINVGR
jgi:serine/threonine-protein kinase